MPPSGSNRLPRYMSHEDIVEAIHEIQKSGIENIPKNRRSTKYDVWFNNDKYPTKYLICLGHKYSDSLGISASPYYKLDWPNEFGGGHEANNFLIERRFDVRTKDGLKIHPTERAPDEESE